MSEWLTSDRYLRWRAALDAGDLEQLLDCIGDDIAADANACDHPLVKSLLESVASGCHHAAMDFYVSTK